MTTWRDCGECGKKRIMSYNNFKGYPSWKDLFKEEDLCKCGFAKRTKGVKK